MYIFRTSPRFACTLLFVTGALISGCSEQMIPGNKSKVAAPSATVQDAPAPTAEAQAPTADVHAQIKAALDAKNYGQAAELAKAAQASHPTDSQIFLLAATAEAHLGNAGNAATAFQHAIDNGLVDPMKELSDKAFDEVRGSEPFQRIRSRLVTASAGKTYRARTPVDRIRAGDVEIVEGDHEHIRAGDIVLDTRR